ncbi:uncharacterized protein LOC121241440 [Juglans microcarpa x Juglans regia]|uniref:uncharacterized protein LOC121241440 n=1 Tax=Juglans microcarpa x Juglans regia TaxID=2249226 RepID=UPI001B7E8900|nr:uncharacterized protein LOC121241440 [Juglans microcarpa x Juglans regia]
MDIQKFLILKNFCNRIIGKSIDELKGVIRPKEMEIRSCYSETFLLSSEGFLNMILLDAIFILELFRRKSEKDSGSSKPHEEDSENSKAHYQIDYILSRPCMEFSIRHDLLLLENQPFFVLEELYGHLCQHVEPNTEEKTLLELSCGFFGDLYDGVKPEPKKCFNYDLVGYFRPTQILSPSSPEPKNDAVNDFKDLVNRFPQDRSSPNFIEVKHFTDLVRYFFLPQNPSPRSEPIEVKHFTDLLRSLLRPYDGIKYTATKLDEAGLKFTRPDSERDLLDIKLRPNHCLERFQCFNLSWLLSCLPFLKSDCLVRRVQRCLEVPPLCVDDNTEGLFRNLMALEQCHYPNETYICDYIVLLDDLITTESDVMLLVENEIIDNNLGSSAAVTKLFNKLGLEIGLPGNSLYGNLCDSLNEYSKSNWNRLVGTLTKVYFSDFFKGTATVAGIIVLVLTLWNFCRVLSKVWV